MIAHGLRSGHMPPAHDGRDKERISAARLAEAKAAAGITSDAELARRVGLRGRVAPGQWKRGESTPAGDTLARLCAVLGVTPAYLFGESEPTRDDLAEVVATVPPEARPRAAEALRAWLDGWRAGQTSAPAGARVVAHEVIGPAGGRALLPGPAPAKASPPTSAKGERGGRGLRR